MGKGSNHQQQFKSKAKNRVADLQGMFSDLQSARRESRGGDAASSRSRFISAREWKAMLLRGLRQPLPSSLVAFGEQGNSKGGSDLSSEIWRLLHIGEEEDDATSKLEELVAINPKTEPVELHDENVLGSMQGGGVGVYQQDYFVYQELPKHGFFCADQFKNTLPSGANHTATNCQKTNHLNYEQFSLHHEMAHTHYIAFDGNGQNGGNITHYQDLSHITDLLPAISPPASAYLRPKCALWDCPRPAQVSEWCQDYCSSFHATMAVSEGPPGMTPVLRPGGIDLKDGPLFAALAAKTQGRVSVFPECEGACNYK
ncbi:uncharacterized protein A4U43_UnF2010 [Asparagus officinalis]|uniref:Uncharacterized protein n=1 Tax=Asparagus officinalis TaxID=4686 RepID=A0A1R3L7E7_ASPOF|nr:uncharacterized protein A4U43_UnF2010 [Asparagus officinalis]